MNAAGRLLSIAVLAASAGCSSVEVPRSQVRDAPAATLVSAGEPLFARQGTFPDKDGPPIGGPSHAELMRLPDAVPGREPLSRYGNPQSYVVYGRTYRTLDSSRGYAERGIASWYGRKFHKRLTSSREPYDMFAMTAAHRSLPLPTYVRVTHLENGRTAVVRVNDRGPFHPGRIIDLSYAAAVKLGVVDSGSGPVEVRAIGLDRDGPYPSPRRVAPGPVRYYVQVGAYSSERNAERALALADRLRPGLASLRSVERADGILHRVRIGPLPGPEEADRVLTGLDAEGMRNAQVIIESRSEKAAENDNA